MPKEPPKNMKVPLKVTLVSFAKKNKNVKILFQFIIFWIYIYST